MFGKLVHSLLGSEGGAASRDGARIGEIRQRVLADAGPPLDAAIAAVFEGTTAIGNFDLRYAEADPALRAIRDLDPAARGNVLVRMTRILASREDYGLKAWGQIARQTGYRTHNEAEDYITGFGNILGAMASRKVILPDPDGDVARLIAVMRGYRNLQNKRILRLLLDTARDHPGGKTVAALREFLPKPGYYFCYPTWQVAIDELLRDLPAFAPAATAVARSAVPVTGFGRKGAVSPAPLASTLPGLPPITLPRFEIDGWDAARAIARHFDNLLDVRLYDAPHLDFLGRLAKFADDVDFIGDDPDRARGMPTVAERGFALAGDNDQYRSAACLGRSAEVGRQLARRADVFRPFVTAHPEEARKLGKLAAGIATKSAPPAAWLAEARQAIAGRSPDDRLKLTECVTASPSPALGSNLSDHFQRTLIYLAADLDPAVVGPQLAGFALKQCYVTQPGHGIRSEKLGNACLWTLAAFPDGAGVPYLARILARTKYPKIRAKIDEKLNQAAEAAGISRGALDELTVPTHDLDRDGTRRFAIGGGEAVIRVLGARDVAIEWLSDAGKPLKAPSAAMKEDKAGLKEIKEAAKEIEADLGTQLVRLQRLYLEDRSWPAAEWRERYLDHPLVRTMARRLIWSVDRADGSTVSALSDEQVEQLLDAAGKPVALDDATIRLWHPIDAEVAEVEAWRDRLEELQVTQPFAQAWREVYALTDAERTTGTYSNRWAAHILKQHQAMTLARLNGWRVTHRMWVDAPNDEPWHLTILAHGVVADYWVEGAGGEDPEVSDSGAYAYVSTDRVQFHAIDAVAQDSARGPVRGPAVLLTEVPPIVFSEVMRQADLFSAVASIAADPNWLDRGGEAAHPSQWGHAAAVYWTRTNTAELAESGKRRRAMLDRIVPRLKVADRLSLDERYLHVQGKRHSYKVHLGSGACFRGERHLCIVPKAADAGQRLWLPFEGDRTLSIILSKAVLLANDDKITDPVILRQL